MIIAERWGVGDEAYEGRRGLGIILVVAGGEEEVSGRQRARLMGPRPDAASRHLKRPFAFPSFPQAVPQSAGSRRDDFWQRRGRVDERGNISAIFPTDDGAAGRTSCRPSLVASYGLMLDCTVTGHHSFRNDGTRRYGQQATTLDVQARCSPRLASLHPIASASISPTRPCSWLLAPDASTASPSD